MTVFKVLPERRCTVAPIATPSDTGNEPGAWLNGALDEGLARMLEPNINDAERRNGRRGVEEIASEGIAGSAVSSLASRAISMLSDFRDSSWSIVDGPNG